MKPFYYLCDFPERKNVGKNYLALCPKCGKKHLSISRETGFYHCFYAGCDFHGRLKDFWEERPLSAGRRMAARPLLSLHRREGRTEVRRWRAMPVVEKLSCPKSR